MNSMILIGLSGKAGSGKDECCKRILQHYPQGKRLAFADPLKDEVCKAMRITREYLEQHKKHFRLILQGWGTDYRRQMFGEDYWIKRWLEVAVQSIASMIVVPDVRFPNEARTIQELGGYVFHVVRKNHDGGAGNHSSETEMDTFTDYDRRIDNYGSLKQLEVEVDIALDMCALLPSSKQQTQTQL